jgi:predicted transcriptional regulator
MTETISVPIDSEVNKRLDSLAEQTHRSKSVIAAEAISAFVDLEQWQLDETRAGIADADLGRTVAHEDVVRWVRSWGTKEELPPRNEYPMDAARHR